MQSFNQHGLTKYFTKIYFHLKRSWRNRLCSTLLDHSISFLFASRWEKEWICLSGVDNFAVIKSKCILNVEYETPMQLKLCVLELIKCSAWNLLRSYLTFMENSIFWVCFIKKKKKLSFRYASEIHLVLVFLSAYCLVLCWLRY